MFKTKVFSFHSNGNLKLCLTLIANQTRNKHDSRNAFNLKSFIVNKSFSFGKFRLGISKTELTTPPLQMTSDSLSQNFFIFQGDTDTL